MAQSPKPHAAARRNGPIANCSGLFFYFPPFRVTCVSISISSARVCVCVRVTSIQRTRSRSFPIYFSLSPHFVAIQFKTSYRNGWVLWLSGERRRRRRTRGEKMSSCPIEMSKEKEKEKTSDVSIDTAQNRSRLNRRPSSLLRQTTCL